MVVERIIASRKWYSVDGIDVEVGESMYTVVVVVVVERVGKS